MSGRKTTERVMWTTTLLREFRELYSMPTVDEVARYFGVSNKTVRRIASEHNIPRFRRMKNV